MKPNKWVLVAVLAVALMTAILAGHLFERSLHFSSVEIENEIRSWGMWGVVGSIGLMVLHSFIPFPAEIVAIANGMVYGPFWGVAVTWVGAMLGAYLAFGLARVLGRPLVERLLARKHWQAIDDWGTVEGGRMLLISRFLPVIAFNLINYAAGLSAISWWTFTWATGIGILPLTTLMVVMGDRFEMLPWWVWLLLFLFSAALWYRFRHMFYPKAPTQER